MEFITALSAINRCLSPITNMIVDADGLLSTINSRKPISLKMWMPVTEWSGLKCAAVSVIATSAISLTMDQRTKLE